MANQNLPGQLLVYKYQFYISDECTNWYSRYNPFLRIREALKEQKKWIKFSVDWKNIGPLYVW